VSASRRSRRARGWSSVAAVYDRQLALERPALRSLLAMLRIGADEALLDVGTGTGLAGLRPLNPAPDLLAAGFTISARLPVRRGYPSLCMVGRR